MGILVRNGLPRELSCGIDVNVVPCSAPPPLPWDRAGRRSRTDEVEPGVDLVRAFADQQVADVHAWEIPDCGSSQKSVSESQNTQENK